MARSSKLGLIMSEHGAYQAMALGSDKAKQDAIRAKNLAFIESKQQMSDAKIQRIDKIVKIFSWMFLGAIIYLILITFKG